MGIEDNVVVPSTASGPKVKSFKALDKAGNTIEVQAVIITDEDGQVLWPITQDTGDRIVALLTAIDLKLAAFTGTLPIGASLGVQQ